MADRPVDVFRQLTLGVYVIGVRDEDKVNAFTAAWLMQVSFDPLLLALSIHPQHASYRMLKGSGVFSVNVLGADQQDLARRFGTPSTGDKMASVPWFPGRTGAPILSSTLAYLDCEFSHECPAGDHRLVVGRVIGGARLNQNAKPLHYSDTGDMDGSSRLFPQVFEI